MSRLPPPRADATAVRNPQVRGPKRTPDRIPDLLLALALLLLVVSGGYWLHARASADDAQAPAAAASLRVVPLIEPESCSIETVPERAGFVGYRLPDGDELTGLESAWIFPERSGAPTFSGGAEVTACQMPGGLDLRPWLEDRRPGGPHWLFFALRVVRDDEAWSWRGWCRFDAVDLAHASLYLTPRRGKRVEIQVRTAGGQPVPGALLSIDPAPLGPGRIPHLVHTDVDGRRVVCGLEADAVLTARLVEGVGPRAALVSASFTSETEIVTLEVDLGGRWGFTEHQARLPLAGASSRIADVSAPERGLPRAWPVSRWIGPGRGPDTPVFIMYRSDAVGTAELPLRLQFDGYPPVDIEDARAPMRMEFRPGEKQIVAAPAD